MGCEVRTTGNSLSRGRTVSVILGLIPQAMMVEAFGRPNFPRPIFPASLFGTTLRDTTSVALVPTVSRPLPPWIFKTCSWGASLERSCGDAQELRRHRRIATVRLYGESAAASSSQESSSSAGGPGGGAASGTATATDSTSSAVVAPEPKVNRSGIALARARFLSATQKAELQELNDRLKRELLLHRLHCRS